MKEREGEKDKEIEVGGKGKEEGEATKYNRVAN